MTERTAGGPNDPNRVAAKEEENAADRSAEELEESGEEASVAEHYQEMTRLGVEQKGEGRIE